MTDYIHFGQYEGKALHDIARIDRSYLIWISDQKWCKEKLRGQIQKALAAPIQPPQKVVVKVPVIPKDQQAALAKCVEMRRKGVDAFIN